MTRQLSRMLIFAGALAALALWTSAGAAALDYDDILGKWCGRITDYNFKRSTLTVTFHSDRHRETYRVDSYEFAGDTITVNWRREGKKLYTEFSEFDGRTMVQLSNEEGPRREFHRC